MEKLGIDLFSIGVQIVNFFLLLFILKKFIYKPVVDMIKKKQKEDEELDKIKRFSEEEVRKASVKADKAVADAKKLGKEIVDEAKSKAEVESKRILEDADKKAKDLIKNAQKQAEVETQKKLKGLDLLVKDQVREVIGSTLPGILTEKQKEEITKKAISQLKSIGKK